MCDLEAELQHLVSQAQQYPLQSTHRRLLCDRIYRTLRDSKRLVYPPVPPLLQGSYGEIYNTALQHLFVYLYKNVESYKPDRGGVLAWVNFLLTRRFPDAIREVSDLSKYAGKPVRIYSLDELDHEPYPQPTERLETTPQDVVNLLREDPGDQFQNSHIKGHSYATFQAIALSRIEGYSWQELSEQWSIPIPTLSAFYQRQIRAFLPHFQAHL
ncbi:hypothetical protein [Spirulina major]|uniref:hypothetical protein n=1 Tax=Spirulina major TaxID=270636 RepID=UPI000932CB77|nr:hypothetical protein [Spirulina major]